MDRRDFLNAITALLPLAGCATKAKNMHNLSQFLPNTNPFPVLFYGHGSPMNAIQDNEFAKGWQESVKNLEKPAMILCVSAHWETSGTYITAMPKPRTIHDFGGFPQALFDVQYPAPGNAEYATEIVKSSGTTEIKSDLSWGLDHGCWSVVKNLYPNADIPVLQLSLDYNKPAQYHYELGKQLMHLRKKGVLIIGSGNMVHNLGMMAIKPGLPFTMDNFNAEYGYDWALELNEIFKNKIKGNDHAALINYNSLHRASRLAIPTAEHYLPLLYILGLQDKNEEPLFFNDKAIGGAFTMTSVKFG